MCARSEWLTSVSFVMQRYVHFLQRGTTLDESMP